MWTGPELPPENPLLGARHPPHCRELKSSVLRATLTAGFWERGAPLSSRLGVGGYREAWLCPACLLGPGRGWG